MLGPYLQTRWFSFEMFFSGKVLVHFCEWVSGNEICVDGLLSVKMCIVRWIDGAFLVEFESARVADYHRK